MNNKEALLFDKKGWFEVFDYSQHSIEKESSKDNHAG
jgi:hypothetical protein